MKKLLKLIMAMGLTALLLTACGGGEEKSTAKSVEPPKTEEKSEPEEEPEEETPPVEQKQGMTEAEQAVYDMAQPKMQSVTEDFNAMMAFLNEARPDFDQQEKEEVMSYLTKIYKEASVLATLDLKEETRYLSWTFGSYGYQMKQVIEKMTKTMGGDETDWTEDLKLVAMYENEIHFYSKYGREIKEVIHEDLIAAKELSKITSVQADGSRVVVNLELYYPSSVGALKKNIKKEIIHIMDEISKNQDYDELEMEFEISTYPVRLKDGSDVKRYVMYIRFSPEARAEKDFEHMNWNEFLESAEEQRELF